MKRTGRSVDIILPMIILGIAMFFGPGAVKGHSGAEGVVNERMDIMSQIKKDMKVLKKLVKSKKLYNSDVVIQISEKLGNHHCNFRNCFPKGA